MPSPIELIFQTHTAKIASLELDASLSEEHSADADVTDHPVEAGSDISDNFRSKPKQIKINGFITNTPVKFGLNTPTKRDVNAWINLNDIRDNAFIVTIVTTLATYDNMAMVSLTSTRDAASGNALNFTASFREIRTVKSEDIQQPTPKATQSLGKRPPTEATKSTEQSVASKIVGWVKGVVK